MIDLASRGLSSRFALAAIVSASFFLRAIPAAAQPISTPAGPGARPACEITAINTTTAFPCGAIVFSRSTTMSSQMVAGMARANGASVRFEYPSVRAAAVTVPNRLTLRALTLSSLSVIPDRIMTFIARPPGVGKDKNNDPPPGQIVPSGVERTGTSPGQVGNAGSGIGVAVLDTGIDFSHPDLTGAISSDSYSAIKDTSAQDDHGHGTHVAGTIGARNNAIDVVGVASESTLYAVKVLDSSGAGSDSTIMAGMEWIREQNARSGPEPKISVVNVSLGRVGSKDDDPPMRDLFQQVANQGVTIAVAAGNNASLEIMLQVPAAYDDVLAIASSTAQDGRNDCRLVQGSKIMADTASFFTSDGAENLVSKGIAISAPGEHHEDATRGCILRSTGILSLKLGGGTIRFSGTSMATPHAAGVAALLNRQARDEGKLSIDRETIRAKFKCGASRAGIAPLDSPGANYSFDNVREGILWWPGARDCN